MVTATRGIISITDEAKNIVAQSQDELQSVLNEASSETCCPSCDFSSEVSDVRTTPRRVAVAATAGALTVRDKAKKFVNNASEQFQSIVDEARVKGKTPNEPIKIVPDENSPHSIVRDGLEADDVDLPKH